MRNAGAEPEILVIKQPDRHRHRRVAWTQFAKALGQAQIVFLPGGFSGGDEPDGSAKLITSFFRSAPRSRTRSMTC